jgi:hypothetical protein
MRKNLFENLKGIEVLADSDIDGKTIIKLMLKEIGYENMHWIHLG